MEKKPTGKKSKLIRNVSDVHLDTIDSHIRMVDEIRIFFCIYFGDIKRIDNILNTINVEKIIIGNSESPNINQSRYRAVSYATLACRMAILGGMPEDDAYRFSDEFIRAISNMTNDIMICETVSSSIRSLTYTMHSIQYSKKHSEAVNKCINYIYNNIYTKITLTSLAQMCNLAAPYLSSLFGKEAGINLSEYIMREKMKEAASLLVSGTCTCSNVSDKLGFCTQSYFTKCFRKEHGVTPLEFSERPLDCVLNKHFNAI